LLHKQTCSDLDRLQKKLATNLVNTIGAAQMVHLQKKRTKPASHCPREWTPREAINALRASIRSGNVSAGWTPDGFPRHAWHKEGEVWYEVRTENNANGRYHGYPVDELQVPEKLLKKSVF
jgi:hypothetical protein